MNIEMTAEENERITKLGEDFINMNANLSIFIGIVHAKIADIIHVDNTPKKKYLKLLELHTYMNHRIEELFYRERDKCTD